MRRFLNVFIIESYRLSHSAYFLSSLFFHCFPTKGFHATWHTWSILFPYPVLVYVFPWLWFQNGASHQSKDYMYQVNISLSKIKYISKKYVQIMTIIRIKNYMLATLVGKLLPGWGCPRWLSGKESVYQCRRHEFDLWPNMLLCI